METNHRKLKLRRKKILLLSISFPSLLLTATFFCNFVSMFLETPFDIMQFGSAVKGQNDIRESIYIPGAGFSGFFYTLGRLQAFHDDNYSNTSSSHNYDYHCFSAGCLALVTSLSKIPIDTVVKFAHQSRDRWISGEISRYNVVEYFVDKLINVEGEYDGNVLEIVENATIGTGTLECGAKCQANTNQENDTSTLQCLHSFNNKNYKQLQHALPRIHTPSSIEQLRRMLIQTTWIPFITGESFGKWDDESGVYHNDGAFSGLLQSVFLRRHYGRKRRHHYSLLLPWRFGILSNGLNIGLKHDSAVQYYKDGLRRESDDASEIAD